MRKRRSRGALTKSLRFGIFWGFLIFLLVSYRRIINLILAFPLGAMMSYAIGGDVNRAVYVLGDYLHSDLGTSGLFWRYVYVAVTVMLLRWLVQYLLKQLKASKEEDDLEAVLESPKASQIRKPKFSLPASLAGLQKPEVLSKIPAFQKSEAPLVDSPIKEVSVNEEILPMEEPKPLQRVEVPARVKTKLVLGQACYVSFEETVSHERREFELNKALFDQLEEQQLGTLSYSRLGDELIFTGFAAHQVEVDKRVKELRTLKGLLDEGLINEEDYEAKKRQILEI